MIKLRVLYSPEMSLSNKNSSIRIPFQLRRRYGMDVGDDVEVPGCGFLKVEDITPAEFKFCNRGTYSFLSDNNMGRVEQSKEILILPNTLTLGCDPEFVIVDNSGEVVNADRLLAKSGKLGSDAGLGELRPEPSTKPRDVLLNLKTLINSFEEHPVCKKYGAVSTSYYKGWMTGFHVHLGLPREIISLSANKSIEFIRSFVRVLDYYIGIPTMLADETDRRRLSRGDYGKPGDFRLSRKTMEYRTPGGFHLRSPLYARRLLEATHRVAEDVIWRVEELTKNWTEMEKFHSFEHFKDLYHLPNYENIRKALTIPDRKYARGMMEEIADRFSNIYGYQNSKNFITGFLSKYEPVSSNLLDNWR